MKKKKLMIKFFLYLKEKKINKIINIYLYSKFFIKNLIIKMGPFLSSPKTEKENHSGTGNYKYGKF